MDGFFNEQKVKTLKGNTKTQALVQGEVPFPDGMRLKKLLECVGEVMISSVVPLEKAVRAEGKIKLDMVCEEENGQLVSFTSWAGFEHELAAAFSQEGHEAKLDAVIQSLSANLKETSIGLSAVVDIDCNVIFEESRGCDGEAYKSSCAEQEDIEVKSEFFTCSNIFKAGGEEFRVRDELNIEDVSDIVYARGYCETESITNEGEHATLEGCVRVNILYINKNGRYGLTEYALRFSQGVELNGGYEDIFAKCSLENLSARVIGEEFELAAVEAQIKAEIFACKESDLVLPVDAYSSRKDIECEVEKLNVLLQRKGCLQRTEFSETLSVPGGMNDAERLLWCSASSSAVNAVVSEGKIIIDGILTLQVVYVCENGNFHAFSNDIPYRKEFIKETKQGSFARAKVLYADAAGGGGPREFDVKFKMMFEIELYDVESVGVIKKLNECEEREIPKGIIIYSPGEGETLFDIGKRFRLSCKTLLEADENITDKIRDGEKIVLLI